MRAIQIFVAAAVCSAALVTDRAQLARADVPQKTLRIAVDEINTLDPLFTSLAIENFLATLVFDPLVTTYPDGTTVPRLASIVPTLANGGISSDGKTITYHLRHGVRFHDGVAMTSADVLFTQAAILNPRNN